MDVTNYARCVEVVRDICANAGRIDALICSAGWAETHPFIDEDVNYWREIVDINLFGVVHACHAVLRSMTEAGYGRIVTIASDAGRVGTLGETVYAGAKAGVIGFTKSLAREGARAGVLANCVCPGVTASEEASFVTGQVISASGGLTMVG
jgi:NAD(P)-dependent dehydrogenase (short-subunit alcohol dehydrogenase family)